MKKRALYVVGMIAVLAICLGLFLFFHDHSQFALDAEYYGDPEIIKIDNTELERLVLERKTFAVFVDQPGCRAAEDLRTHLEGFSETQRVRFYQIDFAKLKESGLAVDVKFYPSFLIFRKGKLITFLRADEDADAAAYTTVEGFKEWFTHYVSLEP